MWKNMNPNLMFIRPNKFNNYFYIKYILLYLTTGISWSDMDLYLEGITADAIRKKFNKWIDLGIIDKAYNALLIRYSKCKNVQIDELFIDATIIKNGNCKEHITGYCRKLPNKRSTKATFICNEDKIGFAAVFHPSAAHDSPQYIEEAIEKIPKSISDQFNYNKPCILTGDKGYIINKQRSQTIRKEQHVSINTAQKKNMKKKNKTERNKKLLKKRIKVEHLNSRIFGTFKGLAKMKHDNLKRLQSITLLAFSMQAIEYMYEHDHCESVPTA